MYLPPYTINSLEKKAVFTSSVSPTYNAWNHLHKCLLNWNQTKVMVEPIGFSPGKTKSFWKIIQGMGSLWSETRRPGKGSSRWKGALHSKEPEREVRKTLERGAPQAAERPATFLFRPRWPSRVLKALAVFERSLQTEGDRGGSCLPQVHGTGTRCKYPTSSLNYIHKMEGKERRPGIWAQEKQHNLLHHNLKVYSSYHDPHF